MKFSSACLFTICGMLCMPGVFAQNAQADVEVDPEAIAALVAMSDYLRTLKSFQVNVDTTDEDVLEDGQKIQYSGQINLLARVPDRLRAEVSSDRRDRLFLYDGEHFTLVAKRINYYATVDAPDTIGKLADVLEEKHGFELPLVDLFRWSASDWSADAITGSMDVGPSVVDGITCEHYAFRQAEVDWQIWIQKGDFPLPLRLVITTKTDEARPQRTVRYDWNLAPSYNDAAFAFSPTPAQHRVVLSETPAASEASE